MDSMDFNFTLVAGAEETILTITQLMMTIAERRERGRKFMIR